MERLTVLLPARNAASTIRQAVSSVLRGLPDGGRVLVLDDASEDATRTILSEMTRRDRRVALLTSDSPSGVAGALNTLVDAADTPLVARMDADDIALPWRFNLQLRALAASKADVVFANAIKFGPRRMSVRPQPPVAVSPDASPYELLLTNTLLHPTLVGRRAAIVAAGGYRQVPAEDWDLWMRLALQGSQLARIASFTLLYRRHAGQVTANTTWQSANAVDPLTSEVHAALATRLLGSGAGAYAALRGVGELGVALDLIDAVCDAAKAFGWRDRLGVNTNALAIRRITEHIYASKEASER